MNSNRKLNYFDYMRLAKEAFQELVLRHPELKSLSARELEIFELLLTDKTMAAIAEELFISHSAVPFHCKNIYKKLNISSRRQLFLSYIDLFQQERNRTAKRNYDVLVKLAQKYNKTQNQIIINWIVKEKNILPLIKSTDIKRIEENISALDFTMEAQDYKKLNEFRNTDFDNVEIDWYCKGGVTIDQLANQFE